MACVQCKRLQSLAVNAAKLYHSLAADLECSYLNHNLEASPLLSMRLQKASRDRDAAIAELTLHENTHAFRKPANVEPSKKRQSA